MRAIGSRSSAPEETVASILVRFRSLMRSLSALPSSGTDVHVLLEPAISDPNTIGLANEKERKYG
jgi:hypothetical protein